MDEVQALMQRLNELGDALAAAEHIADESERTDKVTAIHDEIEKIHRRANALRNSLQVAVR